MFAKMFRAQWMTELTKNRAVIEFSGRVLAHVSIRRASEDAYWTVTLDAVGVARSTFIAITPSPSAAIKTTRAATLRGLRV